MKKGHKESQSEGIIETLVGYGPLYGLMFNNIYYLK